MYRYDTVKDAESRSTPAVSAFLSRESLSLDVARPLEKVAPVLMVYFFTQPLALPLVIPGAYRTARLRQSHRKR